MTIVPREDIQKYSKHAQQLMVQHGVDPTPESYAIWYHYAAGDHKALTREVDTLLAKSQKFTQAIGNAMHQKYLMPEVMSSKAEEVSASAQESLARILQAVNDYSGEAAQYNQELGQHVESLENSGNTDVPVQDMVQEIISRVASLRESGDKFSSRMDASRQEIEKLRKELDQATQESQNDFLTGIYNRKKLESELKKCIQQSSEEGEDLSLLMLDIDHFKRFNDQFGHLLGDEVLKIVAKSLTDSVRGKDIVARYGGEEFTVILPNTPLGGAEIVAESIRKRIAGRELKRKDTGEIIAQITVSIGVSTFRPATDTQESLIKRADQALYKAKASGRNRVKKEGE